MKTITLTIVLSIIAFSAATAQSNKPGPGKWGISYNVRFDGTANQQMRASRTLNNGWEAGSQLGFQYFHSQSSSEDTTEVYTGNEFIPAEAMQKSSFSNFSFTIAPFLLKHCNINSNLDFYGGLTIPIRLGTKSCSLSSLEITGEDYLSVDEMKTRMPANNSFGIGGVAGCQYFFYTNLAIGAEYSLSATYNFQKGEATNEISATNTGANNPETGFDFSEITTDKINTSSTNISTLSDIGLFLSFYF